MKKLAAKADNVFLAPDPDREGEAIAAHLKMQLLPAMKDKSKIQRVTFNEITKKAVQAAFGHARDVDECRRRRQGARHHGDVRRRGDEMVGTGGDHEHGQ